VETVHRFSRELRPSMLDDLGLIPALGSFTKEFARQTGIGVRFTSVAAAERWSSAKRTVLYRVAQEALTNIAKHSRAGRVEVSIGQSRGILCMDVVDDGRGFEVERVMSAKRHRTLGLLGMRERVEMVGGTFSIESAPGKGTRVRAQIPLRG
jgi:signal transduction histidine kinase